MADDNKTNQSIRELINEQRAANAAIVGKLDDNNKATKQSSDAMKKVGGVLKEDLKGFTNSVTAPFKAFTSAIPGLSSMGKIAGILASSAAANKAGSAKEVEKAREAQRANQKQTVLLAEIAGGIVDLKDSFLKGLQKGAGFGLGAIAALIAAPVITLVNFFKSLGNELKFLNKLTGGRLANLFKPFVRFFDAIDDLVSKAGTGKILKGDTFKVFGRFTSFIQKTLSAPVRAFRRIMKVLGKFPALISSVMGSFTPIAKFAAGFGRILGKIFLPITIIMGVWDTITGFIDGFTQSEGDSIVTKFIDGIGGGLGKLIGNIVGFPLDLLKKGVEWIGGLFGFDMSFMADFSFTQLISDLVAAPWNMLSAAIDWIMTLFTDPVAALNSLWTGLVGDGGLIDLLFKPIDLAIETVAGWFGFDLPEDWSLTQLVKDAFNSAWEWVTGIFTFISEGEWSLWGLVKGAFDAAWGWVTGIFTWATGDGEWSLWGMVKGAFDSAWNWVTGIFTWGGQEGDEDWSLWGLVKSGLSGIWEWIAGLFDFDLGDAIKGLLPSWTPGWLKRALGVGGGDDDEDMTEPPPPMSQEQMQAYRDALAAAQDRVARAEAGENVYTGPDFIGKSVDEEAIEQIEALLAAQARASGGPVRAGQPYLVGELGPELIVPGQNGTVLSASKTQRLFEGASEANALAREGLGAAPVIVNNAPTTNNMMGGGSSGGSVFPVSVGDPDPKFRMVAANAF